MDPDSAASEAEKFAESDKRREMREEEAHNCGREEEQLVTSIFELVMRQRERRRRWKGKLVASWEVPR